MNSSLFISNGFSSGNWVEVIFLGGITLFFLTKVWLLRELLRRLLSPVPTLELIDADLVVCYCSYESFLLIPDLSASQNEDVLVTGMVSLGVIAPSDPS